MDIGTQDAKKIVNVGSSTNLFSLYSTASTLVDRQSQNLTLALSFLRSGTCKATNCLEASEQLAEISDVLAENAPTNAVWDLEHPNVAAPWDGNLAPCVANCADLYTTSEGELLMPELISLLRYAASTDQDIIPLG